MIPARADVARELDQLASENLALRLKLAMQDPAQATLAGPPLPAATRHAAQWTAPPRNLSEAGFARDEM